MKCKRAFILLLAVIKTIDSSEVSDSSLVVSTEKSGKENTDSSENGVSVNPQIYSMEIQSNISNRFATTLVTSKVKNFKNKAEETTFSVILPENAFISEFTMEIDGKIYKAYVKEKEEAKKIYQEAVSRGQTAAHVELSARDSKTFQVSVNIEPESKVIFRLTYEELLQRQDDQYELVVNIHPGQIVDDLNVEVYVNESRPLTFVRTPSLRSGNEISKNEEELKPSTQIEIINSTSAVVKFQPDKNEQKQFADLLGTNKESGLAGQFIVQYDVERDPQGGEVLIRDGYFVHFFAPSDLEPLPKHVIFVLDHSGSMWGRKIEQLTEAMKNILSELNENDLFNIIRFSNDASVWNPIESRFDNVETTQYTYGQLEPHLREQNVSAAVKATPENIQKAKKAVEDNEDLGVTNIIAGLEVGLYLIKRTQEKYPNKYQPMVIFLTDGLPNVGVSSPERITDIVTNLNSGEHRASIFSLSFGAGADEAFLRKLSSKNLGFSKHIYEASDASLQLQDFYKKISSPLLNNVTFKYVDGVTDLTKIDHPIFFQGSELVVAGRIGNIDDVAVEVHAYSKRGPIRLTPVREEPISSVERLWAYLTVQQLLKDRDTATDPKNLTKKALDLALKYSFVTDVTSLVVVKPNKTEPTEEGDASRNSDQRMHNAYLAKGPFFSPSYIRGQGQAAAIPMMGAGNQFYGGGAAYSAPQPSGPYGAPQMPGMAFPASRPSSFWQLPPTASFYPSTTYRPKHESTTPARHPQTLPQWLEDLRNNNQNITTPHGSFQLGKSGDVTSYPTCPKTPLNGTGECKIIFDCPQIFNLLTDLNTYLQYFCPLNEYAGVCCPQAAPVLP